jgi:hypothetical protein
MPLAPHINEQFNVFVLCNMIGEFGMNKFDYGAPAELYSGRNRNSLKKVGYRRFRTAADAIRFAMEELPEPLLLGAFIEIDEQRVGDKEIRALYESEHYPLTKMAS